MSDLELTVRTIDGMLPDMPTKSLQKWHAILSTTLLKIEAELHAVSEHVCSICLFKEFGYRNELPIGWQKKDDVEICFMHDNGDIPKPQLDNKPVSIDETMEELLAIL